MAAKRSPSKKSTTPKKPAAKPKAIAKKATATKAAPKKASGSKAPAAKAGRKSAGDDRLAQLERLVEMMVAKDVVEVELEEAGARWRVRRNEPQAVTYAAPTMTMAAPTMAMPMPGAPAAAAPAEPQGEVFKSPMLGTYYQAASPDAEAFCKVGDRVNADTTLCIIEAMKVMNEIKAESDFEILEILVKNGEPVEYGQPMFLIR
jgi:acetyl-CoA carboxylase biotin carboxyl carrier protein